MRRWLFMQVIANWLILFGHKDLSSQVQRPGVSDSIARNSKAKSSQHFTTNNQRILRKKIIQSFINYKGNSTNGLPTEGRQMLKGWIMLRSLCWCNCERFLLAFQLSLCRLALLLCLCSFKKIISSL